MTGGDPRASHPAADAPLVWNVAGLLPGSDPRLREETILVTSHYDHLGVQGGVLYPGANDNGSGVAAALDRLYERPDGRRAANVTAVADRVEVVRGRMPSAPAPDRTIIPARATSTLPEGK